MSDNKNWLKGPFRILVTLALLISDPVCDSDQRLGIFNIHMNSLSPYVFSNGSLYDARLPSCVHQR